MVCPRCILSVEQILSENRISAKIVRMGEVELDQSLNVQELKRLSGALEKVGFEILDDAKRQLIEKIKSLLIQKVQEENIEEHFSLNKYLSGNLFKEYSSLSKLFSETEGITIEQFFIFQKVEKVKELLFYKELSLTEIAQNLAYSSTQHLSAQFKKVTGMTPTKFKTLGPAHRRSIDNV